MCPRDPSCCSPRQTRRATTTDVSTKSRFRYRNKSADLAPCDWPRTRTDSNIFYSRSDRFLAADSCGSRGTRSNCRSPYRWCCRRAIRCDIYHGRRRRFLPQIYKQSVIHYKTYYNFRTPPDVVRSTEAKVNDQRSCVCEHNLKKGFSSWNQKCIHCMTVKTDEMYKPKFCVRRYGRDY